MGQQFGQFLINHWGLWLTLISILMLIFINEVQSKKKQGKELSPQAAVNLINHEEAIIVDLRDTDAFHKGHIINAIRATADDFSEGRMEKYKTKPLILVCARGLQSAAVATQLKTQGFIQPMVLAGGMTAWQTSELPLIKGK